MTRRRTLLSGAMAVVVAAGAIVGMTLRTVQPAAASTIGGVGTGFWSAQGSQLVDATGAPVRMTGINWFGMETANRTFHGLWSRPWKGMIDQIVDTGYNTLRIPFSNDSIKASSQPTGVDSWANPDLQGMSSMQILDKVIDYAGSKGMRVLLDRHRPDSSNQSALWYTATVSEATWISDWKALAARYKGNPTVIGADLHNEPHGVENNLGACWGCDDPTRDWRAAAERAGNAILEVNPDWLIVVEGVSCPSGNAVPSWGTPTGELCGWWGGNLTKAGEMPVRLSNPKKLVYSAHEYATSVFEQDWFKDASFPANLPALWDTFFGYLHRKNIAPVLLGEFGTTLKDPRDGVWLKELMKYMGTGTSGMSFTYWSWNPNSGDTGGILDDQWKDIDRTKQAYLDPYLLRTDAPSSSSAVPSSAAASSVRPSSLAPSSARPSSARPSSAAASSASSAAAASSAGSQPSSGCKAVYKLGNTWAGGFIATLDVTNTAATAVSSWVVTWTMASGATITSGWNATLSQSGTTVTASAPTWSASLAAGASVSIGMQGAGSSSIRPAAVALNGSPCALS